MKITITKVCFMLFNKRDNPLRILFPPIVKNGFGVSSVGVPTIKRRNISFWKRATACGIFDDAPTATRHGGSLLF
jgi:hypothetical protein